jgi:3-phenylpropionate/trans-cinnamate dioxygenase ferredoxin component
VSKARVGSVREFPDGEVRVVLAGSRRVAIGNVDGELFAFEDVCTHDDGPLGDGELVDHQVECPRHGARFDIRTGRAVRLPAIKGVATYTVSVEGDDVYVEGAD